MTNDVIPTDLQDFIQQYIDSIAQLEALLLLRAHSSDEWDVSKVAKRLYASEQEVAEVLARLHEDGFLGCDQSVYRYDCRDAGQREMVDRLACVYAKQLIPVTNMIHAKPRRIRQFADAFKFRRDR